MHKPFRVNCSHSRDKRLGQYLATEHPLTGLLLGRSEEDVLIGPGAFKLSQVKELDQR
jgi:hypothetical protein